MKGSLARLALLAIVLNISCSQAQAVTWFDSSIRPDGVGDTASISMAPAEEGAQIVYSQDGEAVSGEVVGDVFDSGD